MSAFVGRGFVTVSTPGTKVALSATSLTCVALGRSLHSGAGDVLRCHELKAHRELLIQT